MNEIFLLVATLWPMLGIFLALVIARNKDTLRFNLAIGVMVIEMALLMLLLLEVLQGRSISYQLPDFCGMGLSLKLGGFRAVYGCIAAFMWLMTTVFTKEYLQHYGHKARYLFFTLVTCGATVGVFLSADLFTTFIYFEIMSFTSYVMVIHEETKEAMKAGETYIAVAVLGGMVMLMGLFLLYSQTHTLAMDQLYAVTEALQDKTLLLISGALILFGFGAKAGLFPLHIWLPKAHPVAPAPASALLSGILTKAGVFGMLVIAMEIFRESQTWAFLILGLGVITMVLGAILAVFSNNLKRTLACSSMSQIGFISVGLAMAIFLGHHNALAVRGTILHMVNHSLIKLLLFMIAGVVYMNLHQLDLNRIRGFGRNKNLLKLLFLIGALGISGVPLFNGYISKTLIHESIVETIELFGPIAMTDLFRITEILFITAGGLTFAYMIKLFVCVFVEKNADSQLQKKFDETTKVMNGQSTLALCLSAIPLLLIGLFPNWAADGLADVTQSFMHGTSPAHSVDYFSSVNLQGAITSLVIGAFVYVLFIRVVLMKKEEGIMVYAERWPTWLDLETLLYRPILQKLLPFFGAFVSRLAGSLTDGFVGLLNRTLLRRKKIQPANQEDFVPGELVPEYHTSQVLSEIESSLSFGLLLFGLGVCIAMLYMLSALL